MMNPWILLTLAGVFEIIWATTMKYSDGFNNIIPSIVTGITAFLSFWLLAMAMKDLPLGTAYVVWVGIGAMGAAIVGIIAFGDAITPMRIGGIALIAAGVAALKLA